MNSHQMNMTLPPINRFQNTTSYRPPPLLQNFQSTASHRTSYRPPPLLQNFQSATSYRRPPPLQHFQSTTPYRPPPLLQFMGCVSTTTNAQQAPDIEDLETALNNYNEIHQTIMGEERKIPGPTLSHYQAELQNLETKLEDVMTQLSVRGQVVNANETEEESQKRIEELNLCLKNGIRSLRILEHPENSSQYEEFIALLNREALSAECFAYLKGLRDQVKNDITEFSRLTVNLRGLYQSQDRLLGEAFGNSPIPIKITAHEKVLNRYMRNRDQLSETLRKWQQAVALIRSASLAITKGTTCWAAVPKVSNFSSKFRMAIDSRDSIHRAVLLVELANRTLPSVNMPYCTWRELTAARKLIEYIFTDMMFPHKHKNAANAYASLGERISLLYMWIQKKMDETILDDVKEIEKLIAETATELHQERTNWIIQKQSGLMPPNHGHGANGTYNFQLNQ